MTLNDFYEDNSKMLLSDNMKIVKSYVKILNILDYDLDEGENVINFMNNIRYADVDYFKEELDKPDDFGILSLRDPKAYEPWVQMCDGSFLHNPFTENFAPLMDSAYANLYDNLYMPITEYVTINCKKSKDESDNVKGNFKDESTLHFWKSEDQTSVSVDKRKVDNPVLEDCEKNIEVDAQNKTKLEINEEIEKMWQLQIAEEMESRKKLQNEAVIEYNRQLEMEKEVEKICQQPIVDNTKKLQNEAVIEYNRQLEKEVEKICQLPIVDNRRKLQNEVVIEYNKKLEVENICELPIVENRKKLQIEEEMEDEKRLKIEEEAEIKRQLEIKEEIEKILHLEIVEKMKTKFEEELENSRQLEIEEFQESYNSEDDEDDENTLLVFVSFTSIVIIGLFLIFRKQ